MRTRQAYDSTVVFLYATGRERLLPLKFRRSIPYTTIASWRRTDYARYIGHEFRHFFDHALDNLELHADYGKIKQVLWSATRSWIHLRSLIQPLIKDAGNNKKTQKQVLSAIGSIRETFGLKRALKLFGISHALYRQWAIEAQFDCFDSWTAICSKRHPHQLSKEEVVGMKNLLAEYEHDHWPISSVRGHAFRTGELVASLHSWYKYAKLLGFSRKPMGKKKKKVGLVAKYSNEYWHVDTTRVILIDGKEVWIAFVMDNYSKMILGYAVSERKTASLVIDALRQAVYTAIKYGSESTILIADGGSENHNRMVDDFFERLVGFKVTMLRALKQIQFSNAPVEMVNRTIKCWYLHKRKFESIKSLRKFLVWAVNDYNVVRPHYKHVLRTPYEVYYNISLAFDEEKRKKHACAERLKKNKNVTCLQCTEFRNGKKCSTGCSD